MFAGKFLVKAFSMAFLVFGAAAFEVSAQAPVASATPSCPYVTVSSPDTVNAGQSLTMSANVSGGDASVMPTYNWTISAGAIKSGQGTSTITIDTKGLTANASITGTVDIGGYDRSCSTSQSSTTMITAGAEAMKFDEFGDIVFDDLPPRLENFKLELENNAAATGYIIVYGGRTNPLDTAEKIAAAMKPFFARTSKIDAARIVSINGGYREEMMIELWLVPEGATPPTATPTLDPSEVKPAKQIPAKVKKTPAKVKKTPAKKTKGKKA